MVGNQVRLHGWNRLAGPNRYLFQAYIAAFANAISLGITQLALRKLELSQSGSVLK